MCCPPLHYWIEQDSSQGKGLWESPWATYTFLQIYLLFFTLPVISRIRPVPTNFQKPILLGGLSPSIPCSLVGFQLHQLPAASPAHFPSNLPTPVLTLLPLCSPPSPLWLPWIFSTPSLIIFTCHLASLSLPPRVFPKGQGCCLNFCMLCPGLRA